MTNAIPCVRERIIRCVLAPRLADRLQIGFNLRPLHRKKRPHADLDRNSRTISTRPARTVFPSEIQDECRSVLPSRRLAATSSAPSPPGRRGYVPSPLCPLCPLPKHHETPDSAERAPLSPLTLLLGHPPLRVDVHHLARQIELFRQAPEQMQHPRLKPVLAVHAQHAEHSDTIPSSSRRASKVRSRAVESAPPETATQTRSPGANRAVSKGNVAASATSCCYSLWSS